MQDSEMSEGSVLSPLGGIQGHDRFKKGNMTYHI